MCAHNASGHGIGCQAIHTLIYIYIVTKHTSAREAIQISEGCLLRMPMMYYCLYVTTFTNTSDISYNNSNKLSNNNE